MLPTLEVCSKSHTYPLYLGRGLLANVGLILQGHGFARRGGRCAIITDATVGALYARTVEDSLRASRFVPSLFAVPPGEGSKSLEEVGRLTEALAQSGLDRQSFIVALGGGVVGDLAGFVASIYHRGIALVQIPTTVLAQVDSAVGGKTGVNLPAGKNLLGAFYPPALVVADVETLTTLPAREFNEGMAEAVKHAVIRDADLLARLIILDRGDVPALTAVIRRNLEIKADIVAGDEFERGGDRALLNFGHTIGHAIEQAAGYGRLLHGEAISLGLVAAARLSMRKVGLSSAEYTTILHALHHFRLPTMLPEGFPTEAALGSMARDKKFEAGEIRFVLTPKIGKACLSAPGQVTWDDLRHELTRLRSPA